MAMLGEIEGPAFWPSSLLEGQKGPSIYLNNTTRGEIFDPQKPRWGGGLKMKRGPGTFSRPGRKGRKGGFLRGVKTGFWRVQKGFFRVFKGF
jgi:hypothetical protein